MTWRNIQRAIPIQHTALRAIHLLGVQRVENGWDLSINRYKEIVYEEIEYAAPSEIIREIEVLDEERNDALVTLKEMLG